MKSDVYTVKQVAKLLGTKEDTVRRWIYSGKLKTDIVSKSAGHAISSGELNKFLKNSPKYAARVTSAAIASPIGLSVVVGGLIGGILAMAESKSESRITSDDVKCYLDKKIGTLEKQIAEQKEELKKLSKEIDSKQEELDRYLMTAEKLNLEWIAKEANEAQGCAEGDTET